MKIKRVIILLIILSVAKFTFAQDYTFKVLVNKGKNEIKAGPNWTLLKTGATLKSSDEVKLADNAYLGLIHFSGKPLEVKQAGKYKVLDLAARIGEGSSVLNKYTDFILSSNVEKKNKLSATGAVHRGVPYLAVYLPLPEQPFTFVYGDKIIISWEKDVPPYSVTLKGLFGDELYKTETTDTTLTIAISDPKFSSEDNILVEIYPKEQPGKKREPLYIIKKLSKAEKEKVNASLKEIINDLSESSALNKLILAAFYEQRKLFTDAGTAYQEAIALAPDVPAYQEAYYNFLIRSGIKETTPKDK
jgi:hypothetical protein